MSRTAAPGSPAAPEPGDDGAGQPRAGNGAGEDETAPGGRPQEHEARARDDSELRLLEKQRRRLAAAAEAEHAAAEAAYQAGVDERGRLEAEIAALEQYRQELASAAEAEHAAAEAAHRAQEEELGRLEAEVRALEQYRGQLAAAVEVERTESGAARQAQQEERARLEAEIRDLEAHVRHRSDQTGAGAGGDGGEEAGHEPLDASGRLASAVAELGRHLAAVLEAERAEAQRLAVAQQEARARLEAEIRELEQQRDRQSVLAEGYTPARLRGRRRRRRT